jgi:hypothetical protein
MSFSPFSADKQLPSPDSIRGEESRVKWGRYNLQTSLVTEFGVLQYEEPVQEKHIPDSHTSAEVIKLVAREQQHDQEHDQEFADRARRNVEEARDAA